MQLIGQWLIYRYNMCIYVFTEDLFVNYSREQQHKGNEDALINLEGDPVQLVRRL